MKIEASEAPNRLSILIRITKVHRAEFAKKIGIAKVTLDSWKKGNRQFDDSDATLIVIATGIHSDWLTGRIGKAENPLDWHGRPYNVETYNSWVKSNEKLTNKPREVMIREHPTTALIYRIVQLFKVAERKCKYEALNRKMNLLISNLSGNLDLSKFLINETIPFLAMGHAAVTQFGSRYGKLDSSRMIDAPDISETGVYRDFTAEHEAYKGFKAKSSYHDPTEIIKMQATLSPLFLFKLGEWAGAGKWDAIRDEIAIARGALDLLESKLSKQ